MLMAVEQMLQKRGGKYGSCLPHLEAVGGGEGAKESEEGMLQSQKPRACKVAPSEPQGLNCAGVRQRGGGYNHPLEYLTAPLEERPGLGSACWRRTLPFAVVQPGGCSTQTRRDS